MTEPLATSRSSASAAAGVVAPPLAATPATAATSRALARANLFAIALTLLILATGSGLALWSSYRGNLREAEARAASTNAILAEQIDLSLVGIDTVLQGLAERLALGTLTSGKALNTYLSRRRTEMAMVRMLTVVGTDGTVVGNSAVGEHGHSANLAVFAFFRAHAEQEDGGLYIGAPLRGSETGGWAAASGEGGWLIPVSRAVRGPDGRLRAVVVAAIEPASFDVLFQATNQDGHLWGAVTKDDGTLLAPFPFNTRLLENPIAGYPWLVSRLHDSRRSIVRLATPDGVDRLVVYRALERWPVMVAVGVAADDALAPFVAEARLWGLGLAVALVLIVIGGRYHVNQTRRIAEQARQLERSTDDLTRVNRLLELEIEERAHAASELYYRNLLLDAQLQMSPDGILVVDADGGIRSWNRRFGEIWHIPEDLLVAGDRDLAMGMACDQLLDPEGFLRRVDHLFRNLAEADAGGLIRFRDGRIVEQFSRGLIDSGGRVSGRIWFFRDVTLERRAAETARRLAAIVSSSNDAIIGKTIDGVIESWNAAAELMFGYTAEEAIGRPMQHLFPAERAGDVTVRLAAVRRGERIAHLETVGRHASEARIHLSVTISPIHADDGSVTGLSTIARDITRRKRAEAALREREQRNRVVLEALSEGVLLYDAAGAIVAANGAAHRILGLFLDGQGLTPGETLDILGTLAISADGMPIPRAEQPAQIARTTGKPVLDVVIGLRRPKGVGEGKTIWLLVNAQPIRTEADEVDGVVVSLLDISTRKKAEEELRESERHFRRTFDESPIGAAVVSLDNRFLRVNAELCRITGYDAEALVQRSIPDITCPEDREIDADLERQLIAGDISYYQVDKRCYRRDGEPIWLHFSVRMIRDAAGHPGTLLPMIEDITERKIAEERLARSEAEAQAAMTSADLANRAKSEFLATMSHELRSPLNAILGFAEILTLEMFGPLGSERYLGYARDIHDSGNLLLSVIGDILDLSKIEAGKLELHEETVTLAVAIGSAVRLVHSRAHDHGLALITKIAPDLPPLWADGRLVIQMVVNLLSNAIKFTPKGGSVTVTAALAADGGNGLVLAVVDTGIGIASEDLPKVLAPFEQIDNHLTRTQPGTGLGLPLVKSLIELHGGRFDITSQPGCGTKVTLTFPVERLEMP